MHRILPLALFALIVGCGGDDGGGAADDDAPTISQLTLEPDTATRGRATQVTARLRFVDPDGDVEQAHVALSLAGQSQTLPPIAVQNVAGVTEGEVLVLLQVTPPSADPIDIDVWLVDAAGHDSNTLAATLTVTEP